jgi:predicted deacylase
MDRVMGKRRPTTALGAAEHAAPLVLGTAPPLVAALLAVLGIALLLGVSLLPLTGCGPGESNVSGIGGATQPTIVRPIVGSTSLGGDGSATTVSPAPSFARSIIGRSVEGRAIEMFTADEGARHVIVIGGIHGDEAGGAVAKEFLDYLERHPERLPEDTVLEVVPVANPDGELAGTRGNADGVDINRNFPSRNWSASLTAGDSPAQGLTGGETAGSEPETRALLARLEQGCDLVISLHSYGGIVDFDGPGGEEIAERMSTICGLPVRHMVHQQYVTGSLGIYVPERYGVPVITVELEGPGLSSTMREALLFAVGSPTG